MKSLRFLVIFVMVLGLFASPGAASSLQIVGTRSLVAEEEPSVIAAWDVEITPGTLLSRPVVALDLPGYGNQVGYVARRHESSGVSTVVLAHEGSLRRSIISVSGSTVAGMIPAPDGTMFEIRPYGDRHILVHANPSKQEPCGGGVVDEVNEEERAEGRIRREAAAPAPSARNHPSGQVDVLVIYDQTAMAELGGADPTAHAMMMVQMANQSYIDSNVTNLTLNLAAAEVVSYVSDSDSSVTLSRLRYRDSYLDEAQFLRDRHRADLVALIVDYLPGSCGRGYVGGDVDDEERGYSVTDFDCVSGFTFIHELGHNMGLMHNREDTSGVGYNSWSYGWRYAGEYRTVMAYNCDPSCPRHPLFSNPYVNFRGLPTGVEIGRPDEAFNAETLRRIAANVEGYRDAFAPPTITPTPLPTQTPVPSSLTLLYEETFDDEETCSDSASCSGIRTDCDFTNSFLANVDGDDGDWYVKRGSTDSSGTGPVWDHTTSFSNYVYTEASLDCDNHLFALETEPLDLQGQRVILEYHVHAYGCNMGTLNVSVFNGVSWTVIDTFTDDADMWQRRSVDVTPWSGPATRLRFEMTTGGRGCSREFESDMALDDIRIFGESLTPVPTPTPTPGPDAVGVMLQSDYTQSMLSLKGRLLNQRPASYPNVSALIALEAFGEFYFYPTFSLDAVTIGPFDLPTGVDTGMLPLDAWFIPNTFLVPVTLTWYGALIDEQGQLLGDLSVEPVILD